jgi:nucleolar protein 4
MFRKVDAEKAIQAVNGTRVGCGDPAVKPDDDGHVKMSDASGSRVVAVDFALSKDAWEEAKKKNAPIKDEDSELKEENEDEVKAEDEGKRSISMFPHHSEEDEESSDDDDSEDSDMNEDMEEKPRPPLNQAITLFVRNVPFEANDEDLAEV